MNQCIEQYLMNSKRVNADLLGQLSQTGGCIPWPVTEAYCVLLARGETMRECAQQEMFSADLEQEQSQHAQFACEFDIGRRRRVERR